MDEQMLVHIYVDMVEKKGSLPAHLRGQWTWHDLCSGTAVKFATAFRKKTNLLSLHVQTQSAFPIPPLACLYPGLCKKRYFQRHSGAKTQPRRGRHSDLSAQNSHPSKVDVTWAAFLTTIMHQDLKLGKIAKLFTKHTNTHRNTRCATPFMCKVFSQSGLETWQQWAGLLRQLLEKKEMEKKSRAWGMSKPRPFVFPVNI